MDDKKKMALAVIGLLVAVGLAAFAGIKSLAPTTEHVVGSLDGTGPGATGPAKGMREGQPAGRGAGLQGPPPGVEGGRGQ